MVVRFTRLTWLFHSSNVKKTHFFQPAVRLGKHAYSELKIKIYLNAKNRVSQECIEWTVRYPLKNCYGFILICIIVDGATSVLWICPNIRFYRYWWRIRVTIEYKRKYSLPTIDIALIFFDSVEIFRPTSFSASNQKPPRSAYTKRVWNITGCYWLLNIYYNVIAIAYLFTSSCLCWFF